MQVVVPSTPAQMFHMIRRQMLRSLRKPLIVMTPKSLLRHELSVSSLKDLTDGGFATVIDEVDDIAAGTGAARGVLQRQGLLRPAQGAPRGRPEGRRAGAHRAAVSVPDARPTRPCCGAIRRRAKSSGARKSRRTRAPGTRSATGWSRALQKDRHTLLYAGRGHAAAPATGIAKIHDAEQRELVDAALRATVRESASVTLHARSRAAAAAPAAQEFLNVDSRRRHMTTEIKVPKLPESVADATLVNWHKKPGDAVARDENLADLETDKVVLEVPAPVAGVLKEIKVAGRHHGDQRPAAGHRRGGRRRAAAAAAAAHRDSGSRSAQGCRSGRSAAPAAAAAKSGPAARRVAAETGVDVATVAGSGLGGAVTKADVLAAAPRCRGPCRRLARRTPRAHDAPARAHRRAPGHGAGHAGAADHLQRGRSARRAGTARPLQGQVREEPRREARLLVVLRQRAPSRR